MRIRTRRTRRRISKLRENEAGFDCLPQAHVVREQQRDAWHLKGFQQGNELKIIHLDRAKEGCGDWCIWRPARPVRMQEWRQRRPPRRPDERIELARLHRRFGLHLREGVRLQQIPPMLPLPQDRVFRHSVAVGVFDPNQMKAPLLGIKRLNGRDEAPPVADGGEHSWARVLDGRSWSHLPWLCAFKYRNSYSPSMSCRVGEWLRPFRELKSRALPRIRFWWQTCTETNMTGFQHDPFADANLIADNLLDPSPRRFRKEVGLSEERASALASARGTSKLWAASQTPINLAPVALVLWTSAGVASRLAPTAFGLAWWRSVRPDQRSSAVCLA